MNPAMLADLPPIGDVGSIHVAHLVIATSAPVTNWPVRIVLVAVVVAVIVAVLWAMRRGWVNRQRRQEQLAQPHPLPELSANDDVVSGVYLGSVMAGDWLDRIAAHGLGTRSRVEVDVRTDGIAMNRPGARSFFVPSQDLVAVRRERGIAGKAFEKDAVVVVTWMLGETAVDTGIRPDHGDDGQHLVDRCTALVPPHSTRIDRSHRSDG